MVPPVARPGNGCSEAGDSLAACRPGGCFRPDAAAASLAAAAADAAAAALACWAARTSGGIGVAAGAPFPTVCMRKSPLPAPWFPLLFPLLSWGAAATSWATAARSSVTKVLVDRCILLSCCRDTCG
jgi:fatty acid desaturase